MKDISTTYLGLALRSPVIASSMPLTSRVDSILELEEAGVGAVVLKSIFEEQIAGEAASFADVSDYPEAADYLRRYVGEDYVRGFTGMIRELKRRTAVPVIASINCVTDGAWADYARRVEDAGADAMELNIYIQPRTAEFTAPEIERIYGSIVAGVSERVTIPVSVKLTPRFTNVINVAATLRSRGAKGAVMFNRLYESDIDVETMEIVGADPLSSRSELRGTIRTVALTSTAVPGLDISVSTGVHTGDDVIKCLLAGAAAVHVCTAVYKSGMGVVGEMNRRVAEWMEAHGYDSVGDFRGAMNSTLAPDSDRYYRVQYIPRFGE